MRFFPACIAALSLALAACDSHNQPQKTASSSQSAPTESASASASGTIAVWVPAGIIGSDYWIYLNRRIVNAPPHAAANAQASDFVTVRQPNGWEIWNAQGLVLKMTNEEWDPRFSTDINSQSSTQRTIFQEVDIAVQPGSYTLDAAYFAENQSEFPFVITHAHPVVVTAGQTTTLYLAIPNNWGNLNAPVAQIVFCPNEAAPADIDGLKRRVGKYMGDPLATTLREASAAARSPSAHTLMLDLPADEGGRREFDGRQIAQIVGGIETNNYFPSDDEVSACQSRYPEYANSYGTYRQTLAVINSDLESFRKLSADLSRE